MKAQLTDIYVARLKICKVEFSVILQVVRIPSNGFQTQEHLHSSPRNPGKMRQG